MFENFTDFNISFSFTLLQGICPMSLLMQRSKLLTMSSFWKLSLTHFADTVVDQSCVIYFHDFGSSDDLLTVTVSLLKYKNSAVRQMRRNIHGVRTWLEVLVWPVPSRLSVTATTKPAIPLRVVWVNCELWHYSSYLMTYISLYVWCSIHLPFNLSNPIHPIYDVHPKKHDKQTPPPKKMTPPPKKNVNKTKTTQKEPSTQKNAKKNSNNWQQVLNIDCSNFMCVCHQFDMLEIDRLQRPVLACPLLLDPSSYIPDTVDLMHDIDARSYWLKCFADGADKVRKR